MPSSRKHGNGTGVCNWVTGVGFWCKHCPIETNRILQSYKALRCSSSSSACSGMSPGSTHIATTDVSVGDWTQYPVCVRTKVCKLKEGQKWTEELLQQRLDVLHRVRWCLCCGEVCQVRSDKDAKWSDAEIIGDCHRKNTVKDNNGSAYPECNETGDWQRLTQTQRMRDAKKIEIKKLRRQIARFASAAG